MTREVNLFQKDLRQAEDQNFTINPFPSEEPHDAVDAALAGEEELPDALPKEESAPRLATLLELIPPEALVEPETTAPLPASKESGSTSELSETETTSLGTPSGSSPTSPGWATPPAPVSPPTKGTTPLP